MRLAWSTELVPGQPGLLQRNPVLETNDPKKWSSQDAGILAMSPSWGHCLLPSCTAWASLFSLSFRPCTLPSSQASKASDTLLPQGLCKNVCLSPEHLLLNSQPCNCLPSKHCLTVRFLPRPRGQVLSTSCVPCMEYSTWAVSNHTAAP